MKHLLFILLATIVASVAFAQGEGAPVAAFQINDAEIGTLHVRVMDVAEPANLPLRMTVSVECLNSKHAAEAIAKRTKGEVIKHEAICDFRQHEYNEKTKVLTLHYSTSEYETPGQAKCNSHWSQTFNLRELCSP